MNKHPAIRLMGLAGLAGLGGLLALPAAAQQMPSAPYFYGGLSIGQSRAKIDEEPLGTGLGTTVTTRDERDSAYKLFGGYQFNRHLGIEAGYFHLGSFGFMSTTEPAGTLSGQIKLSGINLDLLGSLPLSERWSALLRVGAQHARASDSFRGTGAVTVLDPNPRKRETNVKLGAGLQYTVGPSLLLRAEAERYRINDAVGNHGDVNMVSLSLVFPFGHTPAPAPRAVAVPAYVASAPVVAAAAPVTAPAAPPPLPMVAPQEPSRVSFSADSMFGFDRAELGPDGKAGLDQLARELGGARFELIIVEGHTDRLGSPAYNQRLSEQRADVVKAYLSSAVRLDGAKISATGKGESAPVTQPGDCPGKVPTAKLIACLQPDRRVVVEVSATR